MELTGFFTRYRPQFGAISGMFSLDAALLMTAYADLAAEEGVRRDTLEIGVHHGLSAILVAALRGADARFVAIDLFEDLQGQNVSLSGAGNKTRFWGNMARFFGDDLSFVCPIAAPSSTVSALDLGHSYSLCHIDGGHSPEETYGDLALCSTIGLPGAIIVLDDYFNPSYPGVSEGAIRFMLEHRGELTPLAIGFNKVVFQKGPSSRLNQAFAARFPPAHHTQARLWSEPVFVFGSNLSAAIDLEHSTAHRLAARKEISLAAGLFPAEERVSGQPNQVLTLPVRVENRSDITFCFGVNPIGLSYHLLSSSGTMLVFDNARRYFAEPLSPGQEAVMDLAITCPADPGSYRVEIDLVWEGTCWFKQKGNRAPVVLLDVT